MKIILNNGCIVEIYSSNQVIEYNTAERFIKSLRFVELRDKQKVIDNGYNGFKCITCGKELTGNQRKCCGSASCRKAQWTERARRLRAKSLRAKRRRLEQKKEKDIEDIAIPVSTLSIKEL